MEVEATSVIPVELEEQNLADLGNLTTNAIDKRELYAYLLPAYAGLSLASAIVSSTVVLAAPWVKRPISPTVRLSLSLAAANTVFSISVTLDLMLNMYLSQVVGMPLPVCAMLAIVTIRYWSILVQILHLLAVALNHYVGILKPLHYAATFTPAALKGILVALWFLPLAGMFIGFSVVPNQGFQSENCTKNDFLETGITFRIVWTCIFFGPTIVIVVVYCHIFHVLKNRSLSLVSSEQRSQLQRNIKTVRTTALIVVTFVVGWGPAVLKHLLICPDCAFTNVDETTNMALGATFNILFSIKVFTDTFIYAIRLPDIRKALLIMYDVMRGRGTPVGQRRSSNSNVSTRTIFSRLSMTSPSFHRSSCSNSPAMNNSRTAVDIEVTAFADEVRLRTLVEEEPLDHSLQIDIDRV